jgi:hypothetical protein
MYGLLTVIGLRCSQDNKRILLGGSLATQTMVTKPRSGRPVIADKR